MLEKFTEALNLTRYVFVYGTLKQGHGNNRLLSRSKFVGKAVTSEPKFKLVDGGFPYLLDTGSGKKVVGEVYEIGPFILRDLDTLEGVDYGHYERVGIHVEVGEGELRRLVLAWAYQAPKKAHNHLLANRPLCGGNEGLYEWQP